jgi:hypothetical protein
MAGRGKTGAVSDRPARLLHEVHAVTGPDLNVYACPECAPRHNERKRAQERRRLRTQRITTMMLNNRNVLTLRIVRSGETSNLMASVCALD